MLYSNNYTGANNFKIRILNNNNYNANCCINHYIILYNISFFHYSYFESGVILININNYNYQIVKNVKILMFPFLAYISHIWSSCFIFLIVACPKSTTFKKDWKKPSNLEKIHFRRVDSVDSSNWNTMDCYQGSHLTTWESMYSVYSANKWGGKN